MTRAELTRQARMLLRIATDPSMPRELSARTTARLAPAEADFTRLFHAPLAAQARLRYAILWGTTPVVLRRPADLPEVLVAAATADELATGAPGFATGYRAYAAWMKPEPLWISWRFRDPVGRRMGPLLDGLVWTGERWVLLPRPWIVLRGRPLGNSASHPGVSRA